MRLRLVEPLNLAAFCKRTRLFTFGRTAFGSQRNRPTEARVLVKSYLLPMPLSALRFSQIDLIFSSFSFILELEN